MKKVLKNVLIGIGWYAGMTVSSMIMWLISLHKLEKRIDRDVESEEIESLVLEDPAVQWIGNIDNRILRTVVTLLCMPYIFISCSNANDKIKF